MHYIEVRRQVKRGHDPVLIELGVMPGVNYAFRSVYAYNEETAAYICKENSTENLHKHSLYSDTLFVDVDGCGSDVQNCGNKLIELGVGFEYWHTGNRGGHFHAQIVPMSGFKVASSQKAWVRDNVAGADLSIYIPNGQFRLPGAGHAKTGKIKRLIQTVPGNLLEIPVNDKPLPSKEYTLRGNTMQEYVRNLTSYRGAGQRHMHVMILVKDAISLNFSLDKTIEHIYTYNRGWLNPPLLEEELIKHVHKTWRQYCNETR